MSFEEHCPCGASIKASGYESRISPQIEKWHRTHDKHANNIAKAMAENTKWPIYYVPNPIPAGAAQPFWWQTPIITFETNTATGATTQKGWPQYGGPKTES